LKGFASSVFVGECPLSPERQEGQSRNTEDETYRLLQTGPQDAVEESQTPKSSDFPDTMIEIMRRRGRPTNHSLSASSFLPVDTIAFQDRTRRSTIDTHESKKQHRSLRRQKVARLAEHEQETGSKHCEPDYWPPLVVGVAEVGLDFVGLRLQYLGLHLRFLPLISDISKL
jgi:hypothetical protein